MSFCGNCGAPVEGNESFCGGCGSRVATLEKPNIAPPVIQPQRNYAPVAKKPMSFKNKIIVAVVVALAVVGFAGYKVGSDMTDKNKVVTSFSDALAQKDVKKIQSLMVSGDQRLIINETNIKALLDYIDKNPLWLKTITTSLEDQSKEMDSRSKDKMSTTEADKSYGSKYLLELKKSGKKYMFFDDYKIDVKPYFINISANYKDAEIFLNDISVYKTTQEDETKQIGPYMPGFYKIKSVFKGEYAQIENSRELVLLDESNYSSDTNNLKDMDMSIDGKFVEIASNYTDAKVYINGKDSGLTVDKANKVGPVDSNTKVQLKKDFPWGTASSEELKAEDRYLDIDLNPINDTAKTQIMEAVNQYNSSYITALAERNADKFMSVTDSQRASFKSLIDSMVSYKSFYKGKYIKAVFDLDSLSISKGSDGKYSAKILASKTVNGTFYYADYDVPTTNDETTIYNFSLIYNTTTNKWEVDSNWTEYAFKSDNLKEFTF